ncbi:zinc-binding dehydrogenase [Kribbella sp. NPDC056861]|uniref:zinc-binding dehydrogenase n=1 Tax=Kribbella sp. NPDC056861 TaxID=3154857 RepID=UPI003413ECF6
MITEVELPGVVEPEGFRLRSTAARPLAAGEARIRMEATGVSFAEQQMRRGKYYDQPAFPFVPGYDVVGVLTELGPYTSSPIRVGARVAALTKVGGWADELVVPADELVAVPDGVAADEAEAVIVNGITAHRMMETAKVGPGDTVVVLGANGGVASLLVQLARRRGAEVIGVASQRHLGYVRELGAIPVDRHGDVAAEVRRIAPDGVAAVFDHVGGEGIKQSWSYLGRGGILVSYGTASTRDYEGNGRIPVLALIGKLLLWNYLPNGKSALFFNLWAGKRRNPDRFRTQLRDDLGTVFGYLRDGEISARIARSFRLSAIAEAVRYAESGAAAGKVIVVPDA